MVDADSINTTQCREVERHGRSISDWFLVACCQLAVDGVIDPDVLDAVAAYRIEDLGRFESMSPADGAVEAARVYNELYPPSKTAGMAHVAGTRPPGLPRGDIEDCGEFGLWWYSVPTRRKHGNQQGERREWAFARRNGQAWAVGAAVSGFATREAAIAAASRPIRCTFNHSGRGPQCCLESEDGTHGGTHLFKCSGPSCPGLIWPASVMAHPITCNAAPAPVTPETLTKADIQAILDGGLDPNVYEDRELAAVIKSARNPHCHPPRLAEARQRICDAINARRAKPEGK